MVPNALILEPKLASLYTVREDPVWMLPAALRSLPSLKKLHTERALAALTDPKIERLEPNFDAEPTDNSPFMEDPLAAENDWTIKESATEAVLPSVKAPNTETELPQAAEPRTDTLLPNVAESAKDNTSDKLTGAEAESAAVANSPVTDRLAPANNRPATDTVLPRLPKDLTERLLPATTESEQLRLAIDD